MKKATLFFILIFLIWLIPVRQIRGSGMVWHLEEMVENDTLPVVVERLPSKINTLFSEYNGQYFEDGSFYFTSLRLDAKEDYDHFFEPYWTMKVYRSRLSKNGYTTPRELPAPINHKKYFTSSYCFNQKKNRIFFTRCTPTVSEEVNCNIWESRKEKGKWSKPLLLKNVNAVGFNTTQPYWVEDDKYPILYFSSNRPSGYGGMDIWYVVFENGKPGQPINVGSQINTPGNEVTPYYDTVKKVLYFSSDTHPGLGGYDIFYSMGALSSWTQPVHLPPPFNSAWDEFYFTVNEWQRKGYFSSNRLTSPHHTDTCCHDIYAYRWLSPQENDTLSVQENDTLAGDLSELKKIERLLPLTLYFANDQPNPKSMDTATTANYEKLFFDYLTLEEEYVKNHVKGLKGAALLEAEEEMRAFFKDSVERGFEKLEYLTDFLLKELKQGKSFHLKIEGFASALHESTYNYRLAHRRVVALVNYLKAYQGGAIRPYIENKHANSLLIERESKGDKEALRKQSVPLYDKKDAVYGIKASLDRRIQITLVREL